MGARSPGVPRTASASGSITRRAVTVPDFPFSSRSTAAPKRNASRVARYVRSPTNTLPGSAACSSRAATLTASPATIRWSAGAPTGAITSPVLTPMRMARVIPWRSWN